MIKPVLFLFLFIAGPAIAQTGYVISDLSPEIAQLYDKYKAVLNRNQYINGFRVQIAQKSKSDEAYQVKSEFQKYFSYPVFVTYQQPNFKVRVGNFRDRFAAEKALKEINRRVESVFIVSEKLPIAELRR